MPRPVPRPTPKPTPKPPPKPAKPAARPKTAAPPRSNLDFDALEASLGKTRPSHPARSTFNPDALQASIDRAARASATKSANAAHRGPTRAETATVARANAGTGISQSDMQGLQQLLERLWNPNCAADPVIVPVRFSVGDDGHLISRPTVLGGADPVAARRAVDAVHQAEPFAAPYRGKGFITVNFDAKKYCASR
jgi:outer membrane biosynthesis protein TonB